MIFWKPNLNRRPWKYRHLMYRIVGATLMAFGIAVIYCTIFRTDIIVKLLRMLGVTGRVWL